ncbi:MAG TPA: M20/M25/M40 family metallo-hydrolase [Gemmatimonadales bacterium]|nr:M20/M25/M40 family metallo-hydrolase [Gemmatimonadales bacterium]
MTRTSLRLAAVLALLATPVAAQQTWTVDTSGAARLIDEGMNRSQVMDALRILADSIGPRLAGSSNYEKAVQWAQARFRSYGIPAHAEAYDYGVAFERGQATAWLTAPFRRQMTMWSWAWTNGTGNRAWEGPVVRVDVSTPESLAVYRDRIRGAWIMTADPADLWNPDGPPMTAADSAARRERQQARFAGQRGRAPMDSATRARMAQFRVDLPYLLRQAGALGRITDGAKDFGLLTMSGSPRSVSPLPNAVIGHEDYLMLDRQLRAGMAPRFSATIDNKVGTQQIKQWNVVAEIRGSERPGEVVIVGGHYDSWDLSQGVTDNGTGSMAAMEALRIIQASGLKPKRTIRAILFGSEEEGLIGSAEYAAAHAAESDSIQAVLVLDNGAGMITGQAMQGRPEFTQLWTDLFAPVQSLNGGTPFVVRDGNKGGTDHLSFVPQGVPAFNYDQMTRGYNHTHHSQVDSYDKVPEWDLRQASTIMAVTAYELANLPGAILPRGPKSERPSFFSNLRPSPGLERVR